MEREGNNIMVLAKHISNVFVRWDKDFNRKGMKLLYQDEHEDVAKE